MKQAWQKRYMQREARRLKLLCACLSVSASGTACKPQQIARAYAQSSQGCKRAPLHTLHVFFLSWGATLISRLYLNGISINRDIGMFVATFEVDQMFGC